MPEMNDAKSELEKLAKTYETDIQTMAAELQSKVKQYDTEAAAQTDEENAKRLTGSSRYGAKYRQYQSQAQQELQKKEFDLINQLPKKHKLLSLRLQMQGFDYVLDSTQGQGVIIANGTDLMIDVKKELGF